MVISFQNLSFLTSSEKNNPAGVFMEISQERHGRPPTPLFRCRFDTVPFPCWCLQETFLGVIWLVLPLGSCSKRGLEMWLSGRVPRSTKQALKWPDLPTPFRWFLLERLVPGGSLKITHLQWWPRGWNWSSLVVMYCKVDNGGYIFREMYFY